jgi:hypothetical protein
MIDHGRALDLAAAALDWDLTESESSDMTAHLATCASCRRAETIQRRQAATLRATAYSDTPVAVRRLVLGAAAEGSRHRRRPSWTLLAAAALIVLLGLAGAVMVGTFIERSRDSAPVDPQAEPMPFPSAINRASSIPIPSTRTVADLEGLQATVLQEASNVFVGGAVGNVVSGPNSVVAFGQSAATQETLVWISPDGQAWEPVPRPGDAFGGGVPTHVVAAGPGYVAVGWDISVERGTRRAVWTSVDGRTWTRDPHQTGEFGAIEIVGMAASNGIILVVAMETAGSVPIGLRSEDGFIWERSTVPDALLPGQGSVLSDTAGFVAFGAVGDTTSVWASEDARSWTSAGQLAMSPSGSAENVVDRIVTSGPRLLAAGQPGSNVGFMVTSDEGRRWLSVREAPGPGGSPAVVGGNGAFLAYVNPRRPDAPVVAWTSIDGEVWTPLANTPLKSEPPDPALQPAVTLSQVVSVGGGWILFGYETATGRVLIWSIR